MSFCFQLISGQYKHSTATCKLWVQKCNANSLWNVNRACSSRFSSTYKYVCFVAKLPVFFAQFLLSHHCFTFLTPVCVLSWYWTLQTDRKWWRTCCWLLNDHTHHFGRFMETVCTHVKRATRKKSLKSAHTWKKSPYMEKRLWALVPPF